LRVLHVYKDVYPPVIGGVELQIDLLRRHMRGVVSDTLVCSRSRRSFVDRTDQGVEVRAAELARVLSTPLAPSLPLWLRRLAPDLVHLHMPFPTGELAVGSLGARVPLVVSFHADVVRQAWALPVYGPLTRWVLRRAAEVIVFTDAVIAGSPQLRGAGVRPVVVPHGVEVDRFDPAEVPEAARQEIRSRLGTPLIVATGRLVYYKGFDRLIAAVEALDASLALIGEGPMREELAALAAGNPRVSLLGRVSHEVLRAHLAAADLFVLPSTSRAESFGIATIEAQAMGLPAIVTDVGTGTVEAIDPEVTGLVIPPDDVPRLRKAVVSLLDDEPRRRLMGSKARERVLERHAAPEVASRVRAIYANVLRAA